MTFIGQLVFKPKVKGTCVAENIFLPSIKGGVGGAVILDFTPTSSGDIVNKCPNPIAEEGVFF